VDDYNLSQIVRRFSRFSAVICAPVIEPAASIPPAEASVQTQSQYHHGIDFKNPFTMSKRVARATHITAQGGELLSSSSGKLLEGWWSLSGSNR
jgi:hypothetical protein